MCVYIYIYICRYVTPAYLDPHPTRSGPACRRQTLVLSAARETEHMIGETVLAKTATWEAGNMIEQAQCHNGEAEQNEKRPKRTGQPS